MLQILQQRVKPLSGHRAATALGGSETTLDAKLSNGSTCRMSGPNKSEGLSPDNALVTDPLQKIDPAKSKEYFGIHVFIQLLSPKTYRASCSLAALCVKWVGVCSQSYGQRSTA
eukprot:6346463-Amphidinium_carterae.1